MHDIGETFNKDYAKTIELLMEEEMKQIRGNFWLYCKSQAPDYYTDDKAYLRDMCDSLQEFTYNENQLLVINMPPRHAKTRTMVLYSSWLLGRHPDKSIMVGSYNEDYASDFSGAVLDIIQEDVGGSIEDKIQDMRYPFRELFPGVETKNSREAKGKWTLKGQFNTFLATSPGGSATGKGANYLIIDDLVKNASEANNKTALDNQYYWFTNTMLSRLEKDRKIILVMTRWSINDVAGQHMRLHEKLGLEYKVILYEAKDKDGNMLSPSTLDEKAYEVLKETLDPQIFYANYHQQEVEVQGSLYGNLQTYDARFRPKGAIIKTHIDVADSGKDYLCAITYAEYGHQAYIIDVYYTTDGAVITEVELAKRFQQFRVNEAIFERNNAGAIYGRNVMKETRKLGNYLTKYEDYYQNENKEARILTSASYVTQNIFFPDNWHSAYPQFYRDVTAYVAHVKNQVDDGPDALTEIAKRLENGLDNGTRSINVRI